MPGDPIARALVHPASQATATLGDTDGPGAGALPRAAASVLSAPPRSAAVFPGSGPTPAVGPPTTGGQSPSPWRTPTAPAARLPGPSPARSGSTWRPALPPPVAIRPGGSAAPPPALPPGAARSSGDHAATTPLTTLTGAIPRLRWPLAGQVAVSRAFERPATPFGPGHRGVDLPASPGEQVRAAADGTVSFAGPIAGRGVVTITHGDVRTTYEPVWPAVAVGDVLHAGDLLGALVAGHTGCPVLACLHWGLLRGSDYLNPLATFRRVAPRLLPLRGGTIR
ncbi:murein hydrolase activator EnvC family protein [Frankia sp. AiPs1]